MMHGSEWTLKYDEPEVENVARGHSPDATFSTKGHHISVSHEWLFFICFVVRPTTSLKLISSSETAVKREWVSSAI